MNEEHVGVDFTCKLFIYQTAITPITSPCRRGIEPDHDDKNILFHHLDSHEIYPAVNARTSPHGDGGSNLLPRLSF